MRRMKFSPEGSGDMPGPSGLDRQLMLLEAAARRRRRLEAIAELMGCPGPCPRCQVDAADMMAGRRVIRRDRSA